MQATLSSTADHFRNQFFNKGSIVQPREQMQRTSIRSSDENARDPVGAAELDLSRVSQDEELRAGDNLQDHEASADLQNEEEMTSQTADALRKLLPASFGVTLEQEDQQFKTFDDSFSVGEKTCKFMEGQETKDFVARICFEEREEQKQLEQANILMT